MKFTLAWLRDHLDTGATLDCIVQRLTMLGLEVEQLCQLELEPFIVAQVVSVEPHPGADRLKICRVDLGGKEPALVICAADNVRPLLKTAFAAPGTQIPGTGQVLAARKIKGVESNGMLCSQHELGLGDNRDQIIELPAEIPAGTRLSQLAQELGLDDPAIEISLTPNRADCAGVRGIARDLAASGLGQLIQPEKVLAKVMAKLEAEADIGAESKLPQGHARPCPTQIVVDDPAICPMFAARVIDEVKNGPSPRWLVRRLEAAGLRSISALVDVTNYLTIDLARPLHVYDQHKLEGAIRVRSDCAGQSFAALDGKRYTLTHGMVAICDHTGVLGLGGIIGGESTACTGDTTSVLLESALFDPVSIGRAGHELAIDSGACYRFERGVDPNSVISGLEYATQLILGLCGGQPSDMVVVGNEPPQPEPIRLRVQQVERLGGMAVESTRLQTILQDLGCTVKTATTPAAVPTTAATAESDNRDAAKDVAPVLLVHPPSWRMDLHQEVDLIEEVLRIQGFDQMQVCPLPATGTWSVDPTQQRVTLLRQRLAGKGLNEAVTWSFMDTALARRFGQSNPDLTLANPISTDLATLRPSLIPQLIQAAQRNHRRGYKDVRLFEIAPTYHGLELEDQRLKVAGIRTGMSGPRHWAEKPRAVDLFDSKADALAVLEVAAIPASSCSILTDDLPSWYHPRKAAVISCRGQTLGYFGVLHPKLVQQSEEVVGFEIELDRLWSKTQLASAIPTDSLKLQPLQPVYRDFSFVVDQHVTAEQLLNAAGSAALMVTKVELFDLYQQVGQNAKSMAISVTIQPEHHTLTENEITAISDKIIAKVAKCTGGVLRAAISLP